MKTSRSLTNTRGSLALEQVLFIGAIVAMSIGIFAFYDKLGGYFQNFDISGLRTSAPSPGTGTTPTAPTAP